MKILITAAMAAALAVPAAAASESLAAGAAQDFSDAAAVPVAGPAAPQGLGVDGVLVADKTTNVNVDLNSKTVKCSAADYSGPMLKVLIPGLADVTVLNHRNTKEGAPCIAAGRCTAGVGPQTILKQGEGSENVPVRVTLKKLLAVEGEVCHVTLVETVTTTIRGVPFFHERYQDVADRPAADCR